MTLSSTDIVDFCVLCFADERGGSWGAGTTGTGFCQNCSTSHSEVKIPVWAVDQIRQSASWVGKRFYPNDEDFKIASERAELLKLVSIFPGRTATKRDDGDWDVWQELPVGSVMTIRKAATAEEAMRSSALTYVSQEQLDAKRAKAT
jgi:hypothetical protein